MQAYLQHGAAGGPYLTESTDVREVAAPRSGQTQTGYGRKMPTEYQVRMNGRWRRVYCVNYGNSGSLYIGNLNGETGDYTMISLDRD